MLAAAKQSREENKRREAQALAASLNRQSAQEAAGQPNHQSLGKEGVTVNVQEVPMDRLQGNDPKAPQKILSSFLRWDTSTSQPNVVTIDASAGASTQTHHSLSLTSQAPEQIWIGAKPPDNHGQGHGSADAGVPYKVYVKATVTFVVLSCWASSIAAIDTVRTKRFVGVLERAPVVSLMQAPQPTDE
jgi:hypothetical protein